MPFRDDEFLRKAKVILFYDSEKKKLLPYAKVKPFDSVSGYDTNREFYTPIRLSANLADKNEMPFMVEIEMKADGPFPAEAHRGQATGVVTIHQYTDI